LKKELDDKTKRATGQRANSLIAQFTTSLTARIRHKKKKNERHNTCGTTSCFDDLCEQRAQVCDVDADTMDVNTQDLFIFLFSLLI
jgi:hypothetical protein